RTVRGRLRVATQLGNHDQVEEEAAQAGEETQGRPRGRASQRAGEGPRVSEGRRTMRRMPNRPWPRSYCPPPPWPTEEAARLVLWGGPRPPLRQVLTHQPSAFFCQADAAVPNIEQKPSVLDSVVHRNKQ